MPIFFSIFFYFSIAGHKVKSSPGMAHSSPIWYIDHESKHAVTPSTEIIRQELNYLKNKNIRISSLSPGTVISDIREAAKMPINATLKANVKL